MGLYVVLHDIITLNVTTVSLEHLTRLEGTDEELVNYMLEDYVVEGSFNS